MTTTPTLPNYINGKWCASKTTNYLDVINPATAEILALVPVSPASEVNQAVAAAAAAFVTWRRTPATERVQYLFKLKNLLEENFEDLARTITLECGKTLAESQGEMRRAIENVEVACGIPMMMQGTNLEDIARGIDEMMIRQPLGVAAVICPFNFPGMIPFWFLPYAIATGNTYIVKPSEKVPLTMQKIFGLVEKTGLPKGVLNLVNGAKETVDAILDHPQIRAISFVGSTPVAKYIYSRGAANGKRVQCQGGAKNPLIVLPDADIEMTTRIAADSAFGCAGQRCLAASIAVTVADARDSFTEAMAETAKKRMVGNGLDQGVEMGPVIDLRSKTRIEQLIQQGVEEGANLLVDGRKPQISGYEQGNFIRPTILQNVNPAGEIARTEIFGPVLSLIHVNTIDDAIAFVNSGQYGNMACLFTSSGAAARKFRYEAEVGNIGINIGVAAPMAFFPFSGWKESFFGDLHGQSNHAVEFFTQTKVVVERWPKDWSRQF
ncbi:MULTISPECIES: CoA-acylating methylmalonate-semialdehyde dehydrogenase [unclassified Tolypothrix]|uniref:CoA-acylating methylmalonate-semialdehyde dehydrogenase n=1 Tax=unclassified Tolypothrix TaxID=2649714 RepID=UPI0005EAABB0|nr:MULTISPECIES: CoA-acylating methylmalonate-semialdehyde dehydrogenase [unclassified Tolypothrix]BAY90424.1 methylmalonate-semialdehyde dehydrogenase [Microchaete diplosiphon NIES-3275]EKF01040.1 methylmalonate-semialdehyde dehydrogenase [Tolypothrix sp. PCC 7601]MBE9087312.1 CoA-acylating methylmalonate-semialdehyde dehydrogenase [Tolypothrix sp. LEGE 11397]UYD24595.1 CoA-acylating methylmalonate-semialdehyde dehydrogenase [Tolypothrix sp. PCC 7712]UYD33175.1 CoA-acylating methylmalonate-se